MIHGIIRLANVIHLCSKLDFCRVENDEDNYGHLSFAITFHKKGMVLSIISCIVSPITKIRFSESLIHDIVNYALKHLPSILETCSKSSTFITLLCGHL